jgi:hypothetical protein
MGGEGVDFPAWKVGVERVDWGMVNGKDEVTKLSVGIAKAILRDRVVRRKVLGWLLLVALGMMAVGLWLFDGWLGGGMWRFLLWWGACAGLTGFVMLFALYDALAVVREERGGNGEGG